MTSGSRTGGVGGRTNDGRGRVETQAANGGGGGTGTLPARSEMVVSAFGATSGAVAQALASAARTPSIVIRIVRIVPPISDVVATHTPTAAGPGRIESALCARYDGSARLGSSLHPVRAHLRISEVEALGKHGREAEARNLPKPHTRHQETDAER